MAKKSYKLLNDSLTTVKLSFNRCQTKARLVMR